jgi:hypothetical protein
VKKAFPIYRERVHFQIGLDAFNARSMSGAQDFEAADPHNVSLSPRTLGT